MFIETDNCFINVNRIVYINKVDQIFDHFNYFEIVFYFDGYKVTEEFSSMKERDQKYNELKMIIGQN